MEMKQIESNSVFSGYKISKWCNHLIGRLGGCGLIMSNQFLGQNVKIWAGVATLW
jgi:hypothetical protein